MKKISYMIIILSMIISLTGCITSSDGPYTVTFNSNGGSDVSPIITDAFDPFIPESVPVKEGFIFGGWYIDQDFYYPMTFHTGTNESLTLYAKWIPEDTVFTRDEILSVVADLLEDQDLILTDQITLEGIIQDILASGHAVDIDFIISEVLSQIDVVKSFEDQMTSMLSDVMQSVVMVETYSLGQVDGGGSGVIYKRDGNTYYLLTNDHVVKGYTEGNVSLTIFDESGDIIIPRGDVTINGTSVLHDLAILSFTLTSDLKVMTLGNYDDLKNGQFVYAIGSPLDLPQTITMGMISAYDRPMWDADGMDTIMIQHTAPINPGNSGGALINSYGELIGINDMSYVDEYVGEGIEGLHFAIQIDIIKDMILVLE